MKMPYLPPDAGVTRIGAMGYCAGGVGWSVNEPRGRAAFAAYVAAVCEEIGREYVPIIVDAEIDEDVHLMYLKEFDAWMQLQKKWKTWGGWR